MNNLKDYSERLNRLESLFNIARKISNNAKGKRGDEKFHYGCLIFLKITMHCNAILTLLPNSKFASRDRVLWDLSSLSAISRCMMEAYLIFYYISVTVINDSFDNFKIIVWKYQGELDRVKMLEKNNSNNPKLLGMKLEINKAKQLILKNPIFKNLPKKIKNDIKAGSSFLLITRNELLDKIEIGRKFYYLNNKYFSNYIHTSSFSISQLEGKGVDDRVIGIFENMLDNCSAFICFAIRDFTKYLMPKSDIILPDWFDSLCKGYESMVKDEEPS